MPDVVCSRCGEAYRAAALGDEHYPCPEAPAVHGDVWELQGRFDDLEARVKALEEIVAAGVLTRARAAEST